MGREIKRVALDFDWPMGEVWVGFICPYRAQKCPSCGGCGYNAETAAIADRWYNFGGKEADAWHDKINQDEVDALIADGRLYDFTHAFTPGKGYVKTEPPPAVTAAQVNAWERGRGLGHDAINRFICIETRARRLGVWGRCAMCNGEGEIWFSDEIKKLNDDWERREPPAGDGWQVWETVSEGSPVTPVLPTREALIDYLVEYGDLWDQKCDGGWKRENAERFVSSGFAPSLVVNVSVTGAEILSPRDGAC